MAAKRASALVVAALLVLSLPAPAVGAPAAAAKKDKPPNGTTIVIKEVTAKGTGCTTASTVITISPDNEAFTITYGAYDVSAIGGAKPADVSKSCKITIRVLAPAGYSYAVAKIIYRGFAVIAAGASGMQQAKYHVQGTPERPLIEHPLPSLTDVIFEHVDTIDPAQQSWSKCGKDRKIDIDTTLRVQAGTSARDDFSQVAMDSTDGEVKTLHPTRYALVWKAC
jgi:hypothetical protein